MKTQHVYFGQIPYGMHDGLFAVTGHLSAGTTKEDEAMRLGLGLDLYKHKQTNILYLTLDYLNPPSDAEIEVFLQKLRADHENIYIVVKGRFTRIPHWFHYAHWVIQEINLADWKGLPVHELHATLLEPMDDPVVLTGQTALYLVQGERTDPEVMFRFVRTTVNPWRFGVTPSKLIRVRIDGKTVKEIGRANTEKGK